MSPATASALSRIAPLDLEHALDVYAARLKDMTDAQLTEERHRLEGQWPLGEPHRLANAEFEVRLAVQHAKQTAKPDCWRCKTTPAASTCCSSHNKDLCHLCYRRTHFVEVCVAGCTECAAEGLPVLLPELKAVAS